MSKDTIYREDAIKAVKSSITDGWYRISIVDACQNIRCLPSAEKQGEWIRTGRTNVYGGEELKCPFCGDKVMVQHIEDELFCRHCGARMKGADDE